MLQYLCVSGVPGSAYAGSLRHARVLTAGLIELRPADQLFVDIGVVKGPVSRKRRIKVCALLLEGVETLHLGGHCRVHLLSYRLP